MDRKHNAGAALVAILVVAVLCASKIGVSLFAPWEVRLEVASIRLSISGGDAPVRNRSPLFEIGQALAQRIAL